MGTEPAQGCIVFLRLDMHPADFWLVRCLHRAAQGNGQHLPAEAMADYGNVQFNGVAHQLISERHVGQIIIGAGRAAQHAQPTIASDCFGRQLARMHAKNFPGEFFLR